jgi:hypothetical protein
MSDARSVVGDALNERLSPEQVRILMDEVLAVTKQGRAEFACKHCGKRQIQYAPIPDAAAVTGALTRLADQAWGRPQESVVDSGVVVSYRVEVVAGS